MKCSSCCFDELPKHVVEQIILAKLNLKDLVRFGAVCHSWRFIAADIQLWLHRLPWLMIAIDEQTQIGTFFSLSEAKIYNLKLTTEASKSHCSGSTEGYLIMNDGNGNFLFNPFTQNSISLPQHYVPREDRYGLLQDKRCYFSKTILSCFPSSSASYHVIARCSNPNIFQVCKPHDSEWYIHGVNKEEDEEASDDDLFSFPSDDEDDEKKEKVIEVVKDEAQIIEENKRIFADFLFYKGMLYGLTRASTLVTLDLCDISNPHSYKVLNVSPIHMRFTEGVTSFSTYLVESCGKLLMAHRYRNTVVKEDGMKYLTVKVIVYELDQSNDLFQWVQVLSLGDQMLFLGRNPAISISATGRLKGNCIYFTDDYWPYFWLGGSKPSCLDNGVFYLDDGRIESFYTSDDSLKIKCQPIWITPPSILYGEVKQQRDEPEPGLCATQHLP